MGWLVIVGIFVGIALVGVLYVWIERTWRSVWVLVVTLVPLAAFARLAWVVLTVEHANPSTGEIAFPFVLAGGYLLYGWLWLYSKDPKTTGDVTAAAGWTVMGVAAARAVQKKRDEERARALADELQRRQQR